MRAEPDHKPVRQPAVKSNRNHRFYGNRAKHSIAPAYIFYDSLDPNAVRNPDGTATVILNDASVKTLDIYALDAKTGIGKDANGGEVNLPQTGVTSWVTVVAVGNAFLLFAVGVWLTYRGCTKQERTFP